MALQNALDRLWDTWGKSCLLLNVMHKCNSLTDLNSVNDLRYLVVLAASLKTGYVPLFTSPRNSLDGQKFLVEKTECTIFLTTSEMMPQVKAIQDAVPSVRVYQAPATQDLLDPSLPTEHYPGRHSNDLKATSLILHTSGSTGMVPSSKRSMTFHEPGANEGRRYAKTHSSDSRWFELYTRTG